MENQKIQTSNTKETVIVSRAEYEELQELRQQNQWLLEQLGLAKKRQFGSSSEKMQEEMVGQLRLTMNEVEAYAFGTRSATPEQIKVKEHERRHSKSIEDVIPAGLPVETVEHRLEDAHCPNCGAEMEIIGSEVHKSLKITPPQFVVVEDIYYTYENEGLYRLVRKAPHYIIFHNFKLI
ncbi:MAG: IS66 family transposase zinc-finger binding domain-containing protein [Clostridiales bacterium]|nr:IS66 family transposase zinc-finger binding domain-containing protein [Candidatus Cacconaster stercorequi]